MSQQDHDASQGSNEPSFTPEAGAASQQTRRRLLKVATVAPLVATLHPGAANATASAFQCITNMKDVSNFKLPENGNSVSGDNAVRKEVTFYERTTPPGNIGDATGETHPKKLFADDLFDANAVPGVLYDMDGGKHDVSSGGTTSTTEIPSADLRDYYERKSAFVLVVYRPNEEDTDVTEQGTWPKTQLTNDNQALNATCLCSIDPDQVSCNTP